jgi:hypothetical protein
MPRGNPPPLGSIAKQNGYVESGKFSSSGSSFSTFDQASGNSGGSRVVEFDSPFGKITGMHHVGHKEGGGTHHTVYVEGGHFSWDTNASSQVVEKSAHFTKHK